TGRVVRLVLHGLTQREINSTANGPGLLRIAIEGNLDQLRLPRPAPDINDYVDIALQSGFPEAALRLDPVTREVWMDAYLEHMVTRDVRAAGQLRDPVRLRRYLEVLGLCSAGIPSDNTLYQGASIDQRTAEAYDRLLASLYLLDLLPTWTSNRPSCGTATSSVASWTPSSRRSYVRRWSCWDRGPGFTICAPRPAVRRSTWSSTSEPGRSSGSRSKPPQRPASGTPATSPGYATTSERVSSAESS